jgi:molybdopterin synthase sulfur carrier subunit
MIVTVKYFGAIADATQKKEEQLYVETGMDSLQDIRSQLETEYPGIAAILYVIAVNQSIATSDFIIIKENDELALLPPFAGG